MVTRPLTSDYVCEISPKSTVISVDRYIIMVDQQILTDLDGFGEPVRNGKQSLSGLIFPSQRDMYIPIDATDIAWMEFI